MFLSALGGSDVRETGSGHFPDALVLQRRDRYGALPLDAHLAARPFHAIGTANSSAAIWRHTNLNTKPWAKVPMNEPFPRQDCNLESITDSTPGCGEVGLQDLTIRHASVWNQLAHRRDNDVRDRLLDANELYAALGK